MAATRDYHLGPFTFPRGWFVIAEECELASDPLHLNFFGKKLELVRDNSGRAIIRDASASLDHSSIICSQDTTRNDGIAPGAEARSDAERSSCAYPVAISLGCVMVWHDPEGLPPEYPAPTLEEWDDPTWISLPLDQLGTFDFHAQEVIDNMADLRHLGPTHAAPCEYFENTFDRHICAQRQGGWHAGYDAMLDTLTWYAGPGILLSKQRFGAQLTYEFIANTPVDDGKTRLWHGCLTKSDSALSLAENIERAVSVQAGALESLKADFSVWKNKRPALRIIQLPSDGPFKTVRQWYSQFFSKRSNVSSIQSALPPIVHVKNFPPPSDRIASLNSCST